MVDQNQYGDSFNDTLNRLCTLFPADLVERFTNHSGFRRDSFHLIEGGRTGEICGVDGSNTVILEGGYFSIAAVRAGRSMWSSSCRPCRALSPVHLSFLGPESQNPDFESLYAECFGCFPLTPLSNDDPSRAAAVLRDTLEYWVAQQAVASVIPGTLLLLDGALRVSHASHDPVLLQILRTARERDVFIAAIAKRTSLTWGGGYPLIPAVDNLAKSLGMQPPWCIQIPADLLDHAQFLQWYHGEIFITRLHRHAILPLKVELPHGVPDDGRKLVMDMLANCSDDGRILGYPFPLFDIHRAVIIDHDIMMNIQQELIGEMAKKGFSFSSWQQMFGDVHDEFRKY